MKNLISRLSIKNSIVVLLLAVSGLVVSCSPAQKETKPEQVQEQIQALQSITEPEISTTIPPVQEETPAEAELPTETVMLNPPHGEPFHRCDIPVGSPLNSAPASSGVAVNSTEIPAAATNTANVNNAQANNSAAPKLNPPHGEPFHRCDIAVGSPLPSTAAATTSNTTPVIQRTGMSPTIENLEKLKNGSMSNASAQPLAASGQPRLNPPHGQPYHRCDIAVGSPLPVN